MKSPLFPVKNPMLLGLRRFQRDFSTQPWLRSCDGQVVLPYLKLSERRSEGIKGDQGDAKSIKHHMYVGRYTHNIHQYSSIFINIHQYSSIFIKFIKFIHILIHIKSQTCRCFNTSIADQPINRLDLEGRRAHPWPWWRTQPGSQQDRRAGSRT